MNQAQAHILVVEDDLDIRETVAETLGDEGYRVSMASDGIDALEQLMGGASLPDAILLDLMMPRMNGFQFREEQLKHPTYARIPVAIVTADGNAEEKAVQLNAAGILRKPLKVEPLLEMVRKLVSTVPRAD